MDDNRNSDMQTEKGNNAATAESFIQVPNRSNRKNTASKVPSATDIATEVVKLMKKMRVHAALQEQPNKHLVSKQQIANDLDEWRKIGNITDLVHKVPYLEFFYDEVMCESVIRCAVCFKAFVAKERRIKGMSPYQIARKENPLSHGDPISGIWNDKEKTELYLRGGNSSWRLLKSLLRSHLLGVSTSSHGRQHYVAIKELDEEKERKRKALETTKNLVKCMLTDVKLKAASTHYETLVVLLDDCNVDVGKRQHSRKQMLPMLIAAENFVDEQTCNVLKTELECTQACPHFFGVLDKGTVNTYPLRAPLVNTKAADDEEGASSSEDETISDA